jgi:hypothetical protein
VATAITATAVVKAAALKAEVTAADPDTEVGARSAILSQSAGGFTGRIRFLSVHLLPVSAGLLITLFASWWHVMPYYVWEPPNIHHGGHHATILTILLASSGFRCGWPTQLDACIVQCHRNPL